MLEEEGEEVHGAPGPCSPNAQGGSLEAQHPISTGGYASYSREEEWLGQYPTQRVVFERGRQAGWLLERHLPASCEGEKVVRQALRGALA